MDDLLVVQFYKIKRASIANDDVLGSDKLTRFRRRRRRRSLVLKEELPLFQSSKAEVTDAYVHKR